MNANDRYTRKHGHPPSAGRTVCIDFDATIVPWGGLLAPKTPFPGVVEAMQALRASHYRIVILTSRMSRSWWRAEAKSRGVDPWEFGRVQKGYVASILDAAGIPYDLITAEKMPALAYFDDKAIRVDDDFGLAQAIQLFMTEPA